MSGGGAGVIGSGIPKGKTLAGAANAGKGEVNVLGCMLLTAKIKSPSSTMIKNENMIVRTFENFLRPNCAAALTSDDLDVEDDSEFGRDLARFFTSPMSNYSTGCSLRSQSRV